MPTFSYRTAPVSFKLAATAFLLLAAAGLGVAALQIYARTGMTPSGTLLHYLGDEATLQYPMSFPRMVEIAHAHAFTLPMLSLVLCGAFLATSAREWVKRVVVIVLFSGMTLELSIPWLIRYGPAWTVHLTLLTGTLIVSGLFTAVAVPLYEMWWVPQAVDTVARPQEWQPEKWPSSQDRRRTG
jgi:glucose-6-phosphate-specific signal transduction histidine kinase